MQRNDYLIRGGVEGRERLRLLSRVMRPTTLSLFDRVGIEAGMACLDVGCGGGDVTLNLACLVGPEGRVVGWDIDEIKLELARREAEEKGFGNVEYRLSDIRQSEAAPEFDVVYTRFLLTHLADPVGALERLGRAARPGAVVVIEDIDFDGFFCHPFSASLQRQIEIYKQASRSRGGDPNIGLRLPGLLLDAGFERVQTNVVQPAGIDGEVKLIYAVSMENIADSVVADGIAGRDEVDRLVADLYELASDKRSFVSHPRVVQTWGYRPAALDHHFGRQTEK
jgi:SAM-dependent methyltransferase